MKGKDVRITGSVMFRQYPLVFAVIVCVCLLANVSAIAQVTTADVLGTVTDASGAVVPNSKVTITNIATNEARSSHANSFGEYVFTLLPPGRYSVRVEGTGFKAFIGNVTVSAGDRARVDAQLQVGNTGETVEVEATTPLLQTDSSTVGATITQSAVQDLPLTTRNLINLVQLVPGANEASSISGLSSGQRPDDRRQTNSFSVHGHDDILNNEMIDGTDNNERIIGTIGVKPSIDAIQEVAVQTDEYTPDTAADARSCRERDHQVRNQSFSRFGVRVLSEQCAQCQKSVRSETEQHHAHQPAIRVAPERFRRQLWRPDYQRQDLFLRRYRGIQAGSGSAKSDIQFRAYTGPAAGGATGDRER